MDNMLQDNTINKKVLVILLTMIIVFVVADMYPESWTHVMN